MCQYNISLISWYKTDSLTSLVKFRGLLYMARSNQSSLKQFPSVSLCFECMTGCVLLSAETCVEQTPSSTASSFSDNVSSINIWGALKVSMSALHCPATRGDLQPHRCVRFVCVCLSGYAWGGRWGGDGVVNWRSLQQNHSRVGGIL